MLLLLWPYPRAKVRGWDARSCLESSKETSAGTQVFFFFHVVGLLSGSVWNTSLLLCDRLDFLNTVSSNAGACLQKVSRRGIVKVETLIYEFLLFLVPGFLNGCCRRLKKCNLISAGLKHVQINLERRIWKRQTTTNSLVHNNNYNHLELCLLYITTMISYCLLFRHNAILFKG